MNLKHLLKHSVQLSQGAFGSPAQSKVRQTKRLRALLRHVMKNSPYYRYYYQAHGIRSDDIPHISLGDLPTVNKRMLMDNFDAVVCDRRVKFTELKDFVLDPQNRDKRYLDRYTVVHTSGTTGDPGFYLYGPRETAAIAALMLRRVNPLRISSRRARLMVLVVTEGNYGGVAIANNAPDSLYIKTKCSINRPAEEICQAVQEFQPDILSGYASAMQLVASLQLQGLIKIKPRSVICSGEPLTQVTQDIISQAFGVAPRNLYASAESLALGVNCKEGSGLHLFDDMHATEIVDEHTNEVAPGDSGRLLLTSLYNYAFPIIRYQTSDHLHKSDAVCPCGSKLALIEGIDGRSEEYLWFAAKNARREFIHPLTFASLYAPGMDRFRVQQTSDHAFRIQIQTTSNRERIIQSLRNQLDEVLETKGLTNHINYSFEFPEHIPVESKSGKFTLIEPLEKARSSASPI